LDFGINVELEEEVGLKAGYVALVAILCSVSGIVVGAIATWLIVSKRLNYNKIPG
jgi:hypothetical protein